MVEQELARIPRQLGSLVKQQLWSILYMPQVIVLSSYEGLGCDARLANVLPRA